MMMLAIVLLVVPSFLLSIFTWMSIDTYMHAEKMMANYEYQTIGDPLQWMVSLTLLGCGLLLGAVCGSKMFSGLSTRFSRVNFFTTPASNFEKFATLFLIYFVGFFVIYFCSANIANWLRVGIFSLDPVVARYIKALSIREILMYSVDTDHPVRVMLLLWGSLVSIPSLYALGSSLWPKNGFLMTTAALIVLQIVLSTLVSIPLVSMSLFDSSLEPRFEFLDNDLTVAGIIIVFEYAWAAFCLALSYFRMKEWEVIARW